MPDHRDREATDLFHALFPLVGALSALACSAAPSPEEGETTDRTSDAMASGALDTYENCATGVGSGDGSPVNSCSVGPGCGGGIFDETLPGISYSFESPPASIEVSGSIAAKKERSICRETTSGSVEGKLKVCVLQQCEAVAAGLSGQKDLVEGKVCDDPPTEYFSCTQEENFCKSESRALSGYYERSIPMNRPKLRLPIEVTGEIGVRVGVGLERGSSKGSPPVSGPNGLEPTAAEGCCGNGNETSVRSVILGGVGYVSGQASFKLGRYSLSGGVEGKLCIRDALRMDTGCEGSQTSVTPPSAYLGLSWSVSATEGDLTVSPETPDKLCTPWGWCIPLSTSIEYGNKEACELSGLGLSGFWDESTYGGQGNSTWTPPGPDWQPGSGDGGSGGAGGGGGGYGASGSSTSSTGSGSNGDGTWPDDGGSAPPGPSESWDGTQMPGSEEPVHGVPPGGAGGCALIREVRECNGGWGREVAIDRCGVDVTTGCRTRLIYEDHEYIPVLGGTMVCLAEAPNVGSFVAADLTCEFLADGASWFSTPWVAPQTTLREICATPSGATVIYTPGTVFATTDGRERCFSKQWNGAQWSQGPEGRCSCEAL